MPLEWPATSVFVLAVSLALDAMVAAAGWSAVAGHRRGHAVFVVAVFSVMQVAMASLGYRVGDLASGRFQLVAQWGAAALLWLLASKIISDLVRSRPSGQGTDDVTETKARSIRAEFKILVLGFLTSVDAFGAGVGLLHYPSPPQTTLAVIFVVTMVLSALGATLGKRIGEAHSRAAAAGAAIAFIGLGLNIAFGG